MYKSILALALLAIVSCGKKKNDDQTNAQPKNPPAQTSTNSSGSGSPLSSGSSGDADSQIFFYPTQTNKVQLKSVIYSDRLLRLAQDRGFYVAELVAELYVAEGGSKVVSYGDLDVESGAFCSVTLNLQKLSKYATVTQMNSERSRVLNLHVYRSGISVKIELTRYQSVNCYSAPNATSFTMADFKKIVGDLIKIEM